MAAAVPGTQRARPLTWAQLWRGAAERLGSPTEARWLLEAVAGERLEAVAHRRPPQEAVTAVHSMLSRRSAGEPLQYVIGRWAFRSLELRVDPRVLIPRPETEQLVEVALEVLDGMGQLHPLVVDLGTGSGAIALSMASERPRATVWATDISREALEVAAANRDSLPGLAGRVHLALGSWWDALPVRLKGCVDMVVSNPPYISSGEMGSLDAAVSLFEPHSALESGPTGLEQVARVLAGAALWLGPGAYAVVEIAPHQAGSAAALARQAGLAVEGVRRDLAGRERVLVARLPGPGEGPQR